MQKKDKALQMAVNVIKGFEGLSLKAYKCPAGVWTIGYGNTSFLKNQAALQTQPLEKADTYEERLKELYLRMRGDLAANALRTKDLQNVSITRQKAEEILTQDVKMFFEPIWQKLGNICNTNQLASLTSLAYNIGLGAFLKSTLYSFIKANPQNYKAIEQEFLKWNKAGGKTLQGLTNRRVKEFNLYKTNYF